MSLLNMFTVASLFNNKIKKVGFEDIKNAIEHPKEYLLINTLPITEQDCLIKNTIRYCDEENIINTLLESYDIKEKIIIYGRNTNDETVEKKYKQLISLGFCSIYVYYGGMFEWMLLQDIFGFEEFPTSKKDNDILRFKPQRII